MKSSTTGVIPLLGSLVIFIAGRHRRLGLDGQFRFWDCWTIIITWITGSDIICIARGHTHLTATFMLFMVHSTSRSLCTGRRQKRGSDVSLFVQDSCVAPHVFFARGGGRNVVGCYAVISVFSANKLIIEMLFVHS